MAQGPENRFRDRVLRPKLDAFFKCEYIIKEAKGLRGIADIIGSFRGKFFLLEVKASKREANRKTGRIVLQKYNIEKFKDTGAFGAIIYPGNCDEVLKDLFIFAHS